uniref:Uncharacterized protein n=1 Tax=Micrurus lemniscatus lemniscatus TaxID=129467 RepID=A0A2D4JAW2_MICLE
MKSCHFLLPSSPSSSSFGQPRLGQGPVARRPPGECCSALVDTQRGSWLYSRRYLVCISPSRDCLRNVRHGLALGQPPPLAGGVVHLEDGVHQHGGASAPVLIRHDLRVLAQFDLDHVTLLLARVFSGSRHEPEDERLLGPCHFVCHLEDFMGCKELLLCERETLLGRGGVLKSGGWSLRCRGGHRRRHQGLGGWGRCRRCCHRWGGTQVQVAIVHGRPLLELSRRESSGRGGRSSFVLSLRGVPDGASWLGIRAWDVRGGRHRAGRCRQVAGRSERRVVVQGSKFLGGDEPSSVIRRGVLYDRLLLRLLGHHIRIQSLPPPLRLPPGIHSLQLFDVQVLDTSLLAHRHFRGQDEGPVPRGAEDDGRGGVPEGSLLGDSFEWSCCVDLLNQPSSFGMKRYSGRLLQLLRSFSRLLQELRSQSGTFGLPLQLEVLDGRREGSGQGGQGVFV